MDFPSVNDLDVAAAAAAAALEVLAPSTGLAAPPLPPSFTNKLVSLNMWVDGDHIVASVDPVHVEESDEDEMSTSEDESVHDLDEVNVTWLLFQYESLICFHSDHRSMT